MNIANPAHPLPKPKRHLRWPLIVVGLLLGHMSLMFTAILIINRSKPDPVLPDYYQRALDWDQNHSHHQPENPR